MELSSCDSIIMQWGLGYYVALGIPIDLTKIKQP